jgi:hypothetical protein
MYLDKAFAPLRETPKAPMLHPAARLDRPAERCTLQSQASTSGRQNFTQMHASSRRAAALGLVALPLFVHTHRGRAEEVSIPLQDHISELLLLLFQSPLDSGPLLSTLYLSCKLMDNPAMHPCLATAMHACTPEAYWGKLIFHDE